MAEPASSSVRHELAFLHTSAVHIPTFENLVQTISPGLKVHHHVDACLLADAQRAGGIDAALGQRIQAAMHDAGKSGSRLVVCTCSTIGAVAESMGKHTDFATARIDRAMADKAVMLGARILMVAALESTLLPTRELLAESARRAGKAVDIRELLVSSAWLHFMSGDRSAYLQDIIANLRQVVHMGDVDVVVLAQASMAAAVDELADLGLPVLASPRLGVASAIAYLDRNRKAG